MICPKCSADMVEARATNFGDPYWYCRTCKKELKDLLPPLEPAVPDSGWTTLRGIAGTMPMPPNALIAQHARLAGSYGHVFRRINPIHGSAIQYKVIRVDYNPDGEFHVTRIRMPGAVAVKVVYPSTDSCDWFDELERVT